MLTVTRRVLISAPVDSVRRYLADLNEIARYEPKVDKIAVGESTADAAKAELSGRFRGLPWRGTFRFEFSRDGGYRAVMLQGPLKRMECRVSLRAVSGGTMLEHGEAYELPFLARPIQRWVRRWLNAALDEKIGVIKEGAEALNRRLQLQSLDV